MTDYFAFYGLPLSFNPDVALVKQKFYEFSKKYHPDFYINESDEKQAEVLELSTVNNKAYQVLSDPQKRLHYVLELKGLLKEGENYVLPQSFLMEMMDINEALMDLQFDPDPVKLASLKEDVNGVEKGLSDEILSLTTSFEGQTSAEQDKTLIAIKDLYYRTKYLLRLRESIAKAANI
ncbi:iron-sulfur cluster co-chaperone HscB C-terminal domain-containing protein [Pedobacter panaciterrae]|uniref:Iron-sulfur cluster co-chaperone HscB C-terminal domain-containing protein n=1 Tax=Pedobacter panaciterrae TaxID=363849 RepID=A0ABU8NHR7_9SPHI|nr:iron-sulfur cluster co-chaperone HscB C-terminal domain-containing protein [Pedobacter panaciterrae]NQX53756.1 DnaJ domain-containing protein [Pedobacter panaciterrae]